jgi:pullulanase
MKAITFILLLSVVFACTKQREVPNYSAYDDYPTSDEDLWLDYSPKSTTFKLWSPIAEEVKVKFYKNGEGGKSFEEHQLEVNDNGLWQKTISGDLNGTYYTFQVKTEGKWLDETPDIYANAVGVNGQRAMVLDMKTTNPEGWNKDQGPKINKPNEAIIYELHIRDMTIHPASGSNHPGKYLGLVEEGTKGPEDISTGFDHMKEMGITHVHLLPTFDHYSINEAKLDSPQFNWGYDPRNYNVPEGSFSSDPYQAEVRIKEFKEMVKGFHDAGIGVILDVVYNHTGRTENSNFNLEVPGYYYRHWEDGKLSNASACGNETASERAMMRKFIVESVAYWAKEYHLDGFRFDLMGIHDITTMNEVASSLKAINPNIFVYGEGWTAGDSPLPVEQRALKAHTAQMPLVSAFSDDIRDALKGSVFDEHDRGFVSSKEGTEESIKFGVVGATTHPQIDYKSVNYSDTAWASEPWEAISYVSCHDNHTIFDKLKISMPDASEEEIIAMDKLANGIVLTSQGVPFLHAGAEMLRTKFGEHNSYNKPDSINQIDWNRKAKYADVVDYYKNLIKLRKAHPAFWMPTSESLRNHLTFKTVKDGLVSYQISENANGDTWKNIYVIYNAQNEAVHYQLKGEWKVALLGDQFNFSSTKHINGKVKIPAISMAIFYQE